MAFKIFWSPQALDDLHSLTSFIAQDNPGAAEKMGLAIIESTRLLAEHPLLGRMVPEERSPIIREIIRSPYRIVYEINRRRQTVDVLRVWHGARGDPVIK